MKVSELRKLTYRQLQALQEKIEAAIARRQTGERAVMKKNNGTVAKKAKVLVSDSLRGKSRKAPQTRETAVKYRHPKNRTLSWTGRGRRPNWRIQEGGDIERFRVA